MNTRRAARLARGWALAAFATLVSAFVHVLAGGEMPGFLPVALALLVGGTLGTALLARRLSVWRLSLGVLASQIVLHGLFSLGTGGAIASGAQSSAAASAHAHHGAVGQLFGATPFTGISHGFFDHDGTMLLGHLLAAVVTVGAVLYGAGALAALGFAARALLALLLPPRFTAGVLPDAAHGRVPAASRVLPPLSGVYLSPMRRRGPPPLALAF